MINNFKKLEQLHTEEIKKKTSHGYIDLNECTDEQILYLILLIHDRFVSHMQYVPQLVDSDLLVGTIRVRPANFELFVDDLGSSITVLKKGTMASFRISYDNPDSLEKANRIVTLNQSLAEEGFPITVID